RMEQCALGSSRQMTSYCWGQTYTPHRVLDELDDAVLVTGDRLVPRSKIIGWAKDGQKAQQLVSGGNWIWGTMLANEEGLYFLPDFGGQWIVKNARLLKMQQLSLFQKIEPSKPASKVPLTFEIPEGTRTASCKGCGAEIYWVLTQNKKKMCCNPDGTAHWGTCPEASKFSTRKKKLEPIPPETIDAPDEEDEQVAIACGALPPETVELPQLDDALDGELTRAVEIGLPELQIGDRVRVVLAGPPLEHLLNQMGTVQALGATGLPDLISVRIDNDAVPKLFRREALDLIESENPTAPIVSGRDLLIGQSVKHKSKWPKKSARSSALVNC
ncbi:MAG TPA: hypothetical protein V6D19_18735, partial [Stenomitos sp.]